CDVEVRVVHKSRERTSETAEEAVLVYRRLHRCRDLGQTIQFADAAGLQLQQRVRLDATREAFGQSCEEVQTRATRRSSRRECHHEGARGAVAQTPAAGHERRE